MVCWKRVGAMALPWLWACTTPAPPPPNVAPLEVTPAAATAVPTAPAEVAPPRPSGPIAIELPANPSCVLEGTWNARKWRTTLLARPAGPAFAEVASGEARLHFPAGSRPSTQGLELSADGIYVAGHVDSAATDLHAAKAFWFSGLALPTVKTLLTWEEAAPGQLTVSTDAPGSLQVVAPPLLAVVACSAVALSPGKFNAEDGIDGFKKAKTRKLVGDRPVDIALEPGGQTVARANPGNGQVDVSLLKVQGANSRIAWRVGSLYVVGWVRNTDIHVPNGGTGYGSGHGRLGGPHYVGNYKKVVCAGDVQLLAEVGDETFVAGRILAGTTIELQSLNDRATQVRVRSERIAPSSGAEWSVPNTDLQDCKEPPR